MRTTRAFLLFALIAASTAIHGQDEAPALSVERSYYIYHGTSRVGWFKAALNEVKEDGKTLINETSSLSIAITRSYDEQAFVITQESSEFYGTDGSPLRGTSTTTSGPQVTKRETSFTADQINVKVTITGSEAKDITVERKGRKLLTAVGAWRALQAENRVKAGEKLEYEKFSEDSMSIVKDTWTIGGSVTRKARDGTAYTGTDVMSVSGGHAMRFVLDEKGLPWTGTVPGGFSFEVTAAIDKDFKPEPVQLESAMESDVAIADWRKLEQMDVLIPFKHDDGDGIEPLADTNHYHDVQKFSDDNGSGYLLRLKSRRLADDAKTPMLPLAEMPEDIKGYLKPTPMCESDDAELLAKAREITKGITDSREAARLLSRWVFEYLGKATGDTAAASAKQAFKEKKGDCTEHAALFVALARAAGLPARNAAGIVYLSGKEAGLFGYHAWAEVWLGQWVPLDPTVNELGTSARYILFGYDEPGETSSNGRVSRCMGQKIKPRVEAYELPDKSWKRKDGREFKPAETPEGESK